MNCKQNDLAIIVIASCNPDNLGKIIRCVEPFIGGELGAAWVVEPKLQGFTGVYDCALRPIRDPGPDAVDEIVRSVGAAPMTLVEVVQRDEVSQ